MSNAQPLDNGLSKLPTEEPGENTNKGTYLIKVEPVEGTPFQTVGTDEEGYKLAFGKYLLTKEGMTKHELNEYLANNTWNIVTDLIMVILDIHEKQKEIEIKRMRDDIGPIYGKTDNTIEEFTVKNRITNKNS